MSAFALYQPGLNAAECLDADGDGWGWDGEQSCVASGPVPGTCVDTDPQNDGWGWNGVESCQVEITMPVCLDSAPVGDGWGWNGSESCRLEVTELGCFDSPPVGDGWGWNGVESCRVGAGPELPDFVMKVELSGVNSFFDYYPVGSQLEFFQSYEPDLYSLDSGRYGDVFQRDTQSGAIKVLSKGTDGSEANNRNSLQGASADGTTLLIASAATNLTEEPGSGVSQLYLYDVPSATFTPISRSVSGDSPWEHINWGYLSSDGTTAVFGGYSGNVVPDDRNSTADVFMYSQTTGTTRRINLGPNGEEANDFSQTYGISANGQYVLFYSRANNLTTQLTGGSELYLYDANLDEVSLIPTIGSVPNSARAGGISDDGSVIVYTYRVQIQGQGYNRIAQYNRDTGETSVVYETIGSIPQTGSSFNPVITADGQYVAFRSNDPSIAADFVGDSEESQIYLTDLSQNTTILVSRSATGAPANGDVSAPTFVNSDKFIRFNSSADNIVANDSSARDTFLFEMPTM